MGTRGKNDQNKKLKWSPNLVFFHSKSEDKSEIEEFQTYYNMAERKYHTGSTWQFQNYECWATTQGWIFTVSPDNKCSLFDLFSEKTINLPSVELNDQLKRDHYEVVLTKMNKIMLVNHTRKSIHFYDGNSKEEKWLTYNYGDEGDEKDLLIIGSCNGQFYGASDAHFLKINHVPKPKITTMEPLNIEKLGCCCMSRYMVEARKDLYIVCKYFSSANPRIVSDFDVWKRDNSSKAAWKKVDDIGDLVFFLSQKSTGTAWPAKEIESKGNLIYYVEHQDKRLHCYDIEEGTVTVDLPVPYLKSQLCYPTWIFPTTLFEHIYSKL